jgi:hypothetical protein
MEDEEIAETVTKHTGGEAEMFREGWRRFFRNNMLAPKPGARETGCPPGTTRTDAPRKLIYDVDDPNNQRPKFAFWKTKPKEK